MELIIAIIGTITAVVTVCLTNYFTKKNELVFEERRVKEKYYFEYLECISNNINFGNENDTLNENKAFNKLILIANIDVLKSLYEFQNLRISNLKYNNIENYEEKYNKIFKKLIKNIRKDLYGKNEKKFPEIYLLGRSNYEK